MAAPVNDPLRPQNPLVAQRWILGGIGVMVVASLIAVYFALGLLFWQGQWQFIFHPSHVIARTPAGAGVRFESVRFDAAETGQTRLTGWWIPAQADSAAKNAPVLLYLHDARGSLSDALPDLLALHALGENIFAFDPRGFGRSEWAKPSESHWNADANAALFYLASVRLVAPRRVVVIGRGLGATVAANLALRHPDLRGLVMIDPQPPTLALLEVPRWTRILPVRLLARDRFSPARALASPSLDKLFLLPGNAARPAYLAHAAQPAQAIPDANLGNAQTASALNLFLSQSHAGRAP